jgi:hypothetical protein
MGKTITAAAMSIDGDLAGPGDSGFEATRVADTADAVRKGQP